MKNNKSAFRYMSGARRYFVAAIFSALLYTIFTFLVPQIIRITVDNIIGSYSVASKTVLSFLELLGGRGRLRANLIFCAIGIAACAAVSGVFNYCSQINITKGTETYIKKLRDALMAHIERLPFSWHTANVTGDIIQRCTADVDTLKEFISTQLIEVIRTVILIGVALFIMFSMNTELALVFAVTVPVIVAYSLLFHSRISRQFRHADEAEGELLTDVQENLTGVRVVRAFGREKHEREKFDRISDKFVDSWVKLGYTLGVFWGIGDLATCVQLMSVISAGAYLAAKGRMTLGIMLAFISYTQMLSGPVRQLGKSLSELSKAGVSAERICEILDAEAETEPTDALKSGFGGDICFEHVSFSYGGQEILHDICFSVKEGATLGILGTTGSGKTTITYLLNRLYEPTSGRITVGGTDIRDFDRDYLRTNIGLVLQEPFLFSKTIAENIALSSDNADLDAIRHSAAVASIDKEILSFPSGYDTVVGERGVTLSGGQKQRISIARTLMLRCPVMVFDDSLSAVDMETDFKIRNSLSGETKGSTVILISHRIATLMQADSIIVLDGGKICEQGTHGELMEKGGIYSRVFEIQSGYVHKDGGERNA